jgi:hypothetical protein
MFQYPDKFSKVLQTCLTTTNSGWWKIEVLKLSMQLSRLFQKELHIHIKFCIIFLDIRDPIFGSEFFYYLFNFIRICYCFGFSSNYLLSAGRNFYVWIFCTFLYQLVFEPWTGSRYNTSPSFTNQTGLGISSPDILPVTLRSISFDLSSTSLIGFDMTYSRGRSRFKLFMKSVLSQLRLGLRIRSFQTLLQVGCGR